MAVSCPECGGQFRLSQALCDDWRDADRHFGCPHCGVFLRREPGPDRSRLRAGLFAGPIASPTGLLLVHGYANGDVVVMIGAGVIFCGVLALMLVDLLGRPKTFAPTGQRRLAAARATD